MRSEELTVPGAIHDVCSAIHPLAVGSPAFREIAATGAARRPRARVDPLRRAARPPARRWSGGGAASLGRRHRRPASGADAARLPAAVRPARRGRVRPDRRAAVAAHDPARASARARALRGASGIRRRTPSATRGFDTDEAQALFAGLAGHSILSLKAPVTAGYGLMLGVLAHVVGWPMARGGSQRIADALVAVLERPRRHGRVRPPGRRRSPSCRPPMPSCSTSRRAR